MPSTVGIVGGAGSLKNPSEAKSLGYRVNYVDNPSFEVDSGGWIGYNGGTISRVTSESVDGSYSLQVENVGASGVEFSGNNGLRIPFVAGQGTYYFSAYVKLAPGASTALYYLRHLQYETDTSTTTVSSGNVGSQTLSDTGSWVRLSGTIDKATVANYLVLRVLTNSTTDTDIFYIDSVMLEYTTDLRPYFDGSTTGGFWTGTPHASFSGGTPYI